MVDLGLLRGTRYWVLVASLALGGVELQGQSQAQSQVQGLLREVYADIGGASVSDLTDHSSFPLRPTSESIIPTFEAPTNVDEDYGQRIRGFLLPPETGSYTFWIASDDGGALFLSSDESPANVKAIASVPGWTAAKAWTKYPEQKSEPVPLVKGRRYYVEALMKERGGGDHLAVRWQLPNGRFEAPIPGVRLQPVGIGVPEITRHPGAVSAMEGGTATFKVEVSRALGVSYQWQRDSVDIPGATNAELALEGLALSDDGALIRVRVSSSEGAVTSRAARLTVRGDAAGPALVSVLNLGNANSLTVTFSEPVDEATATHAANYSIDGDVKVMAARLTAGGRTVVLETSTLQPGLTYQLGVKNIRDRAEVPNVIAKGAMQSFAWNFEPLPPARLKGAPEPEGPVARSTGFAITEIHYHPQSRGDGRNLEFIEIYNSQPWPEDLSGCRLSGAVDYLFPEGTLLDGGSYLVVAAVPEDVKTHYGLDSVSGPFEGALPNGGGTIRLRNRIDAILLEVDYGDRDGWPISADGWGHSMVLARPSYGQGDVRSWFASVAMEGSPGKADPQLGDAYSGVVFNEVLAHTDDPILDYLELYNYSDRDIDLSGCGLGDHPSEARFVIPEGTVIPARGYLAFDQSQLGFALSSAGETVALRVPEGGQVIDIFRFGGQENGVSIGRFPDGASLWNPLEQLTPGAANASPRAPRMVINEMMYHPISEDSGDEFLELYNAGSTPVDLSDWRVTGEIRLGIPEGTLVPGGGFLVLAKDAVRLRENYPALTEANTVGDFRGTLSNRGGRVALERPEVIEGINEEGEVIRERIWITEDEVHYHDGGRWGQWADGGGSSLELTDPRSDNRYASNWRDSDETEKSQWTMIEHSGRLDNGRGAFNELQILMLGRGECLVDDLFVGQGNGGNRVPNPSFDEGLDDWVLQGNHVRSGLSAGGSGFQSKHSLHLRATSGGDNGANRVETDLTSNLSNGQRATLRARVRWLRGHPEMLLRLHGNPIELSGRMQVPSNLGTPGQVNSQGRPNIGPAIVGVRHDPVLPRTGRDVEVTAQVSDPDGLANLLLKYRRDREDDYQSVVMQYRGAGAYTATIPGQANRALVAFYVEATDGHGESETSQFPRNPRNQECLVRWGESRVRSEFGTYRLWVADDNLQTWRRREKLSNELIDTTFVYGDYRAIYNTRSRFRGSPFIRPGYGNPASRQPTAMVVVFPDDDAFLGVSKVNLDGLEQPGRDNTLQRERASFWIAQQMDLPYSHQRYVQFLVNGIQKGEVFTDSQHPSSEYVETWFPDQSEGDLYKIDDWFEFNDSVLREFNENATLRRYVSEGELKVARYRWSWEKKPNRGYADDYSSLIELVEAVNARNSVYQQAVESIVDMEQWMRIFAVRHIVGDWDGYGYNRGKNMSAYKPDDGRWKMILWDLDFSLGGGSHGTSQNMFSTSDPTVSRMYRHPAFRRAYLRAWQDAIEGPLSVEKSTPMLDAVYRAFRDNSVSASAPTGIKNWIRGRRNYLIRELRKENAPFAITTHSGEAFASSDSVVTLEGTAPVSVKTIQINGVSYPLTWTSVSDWRVKVPLTDRENVFHIAGFDHRGEQVSEGEDRITVNYSGTAQDPADYLVINELMYHPAVSGAGFVELFNRSQTHSFDLTGYLLNGAGFEFAPGSVLGPQDYAVVVSDRQVFSEIYGRNVAIAGEFSGRLANDGETISLIDRSSPDGMDRVIDEVTFEDRLPWPELADGQGASLQLMDPEVDNRRVAHWSAIAPSGEVTGPKTLVTMTSRWRYHQSGKDLGTRWRNPDFDDAAWENGRGLLYVESSGLPAAKNTALTLGQSTYYFRQTFDVEAISGLELEASLIVDDGAVVYLNGKEVLRLRMGSGTIRHNTFASETVTNAELEGPFPIPSAALVEGENVLAVEVHQTNATSSDIVFGLALVGESRGGVSATPGQVNSNRSVRESLPALWLNELVVENLTGFRDRAGDADPWVELYNAGAESISLEGLRLGVAYDRLDQWIFPKGARIAAGEYRILWCDGEGNENREDEWHADLRLPPGTGSLILSSATESGATILDYLNYRDLRPDRSYGALPNGSPNRRRSLLVPTPGALNVESIPPVAVTINEWMADNQSAHLNPVTGTFDDWFELHNGGGQAVDLSGYFISDDPGRWDQFEIPPGTLLQPNSFLLVWAGGTARAERVNEALHAGFRLSRTGEVLTLSSPTGEMMDQVTFLQQTADVSQGRLPDGNPTRMGVLPTSSPGQPNVGDSGPNLPPMVLPVPNRVIEEGEVFVLNVGAFDPEGNPLHYALGENAPPGATIDPRTGRMRWVTNEAHGPGAYVIPVTVTDDGQPPQSVSHLYGVRVEEVNAPPTISGINPQRVAAGSILVLPVRAADPDLPEQALSYRLKTSGGAIIDPATGEITWRLPSDQQPGPYEFVVEVVDDGTPSLSAVHRFEVVVTAPIRDLELEWVQSDGGDMVFQWNTVAGVTYVVMASEEIESDEWTPMVEVIGDGEPVRVRESIVEGGRRFYRVVQAER